MAVPSGYTHIAECACGWKVKGFKSNAEQLLERHFKGSKHKGPMKGSVRPLRAAEK